MVQEIAVNGAGNRDHAGHAAVSMVRQSTLGHQTQHSCSH